MRTKVVHTSLDCSVLLIGNLYGWNGGQSYSNEECEAAIFSTIIVSITFVIAEEGLRSQNAQPKIAKIRLQSTSISLNLAKNTKLSH